jgi:hypothetical protein
MRTARIAWCLSRVTISRANNRSDTFNDTVAGTVTGSAQDLS